jgi:hypothetical protein
VGGFAGADDLLAGMQGRLDLAEQARLGGEAALARPVERAQGAVGAGGDREAVVAARAGDRDAEETAGRL